MHLAHLILGSSIKFSGLLQGVHQYFKYTMFEENNVTRTKQILYTIHELLRIHKQSINKFLVEIRTERNKNNIRQK